MPGADAPPPEILPSDWPSTRQTQIDNLNDSLLNPSPSDALKSLVGILLLLTSFGLLLFKSLFFSAPP